VSSIANDPEGNPIVLPSNTAGWRIRRCPKRGRPESPIAGHDGTPLLVPLDVDPDELTGLLAELGEAEAGRYRLDPVDDVGRLVGAAFAVWELRVSVKAAGPADLQEALMASLASNERMVKTMADAMTNIAGAFTTVVEASARANVLRVQNGVSVEPDSTDEDTGEPKAPPTQHVVDWTPLIQGIAPVLERLGGLAAAKLLTATSGGGGGGK
jgi:hypothetical protein